MEIKNFINSFDKVVVLFLCIAHFLCGDISTGIAWTFGYICVLEIDELKK